ncbi:HAD-IC family P-type ATPase [Streptococcus sp. DD13]|uniref:HAD-IC family P-type ATPase n=1 Tax=Streptococcus sp. DD13 TaxID=1777881 RepID=UPI000795AE90|nr:HAD-IC family P-type ATPase [Streptococcus sp. DD13]KXT79032.1 Cation-transporting ATPase, E1-E2 family [Streptococcus sp. DD13]
MKTGLTHAQVAEKIRQGRTNAVISDTENSVIDIVKRNTFTFFNLIFLMIALLLAIVQAWNQLTFLPIIIINTVIGIYQEIRAKQILDEMNLLHASHTTVIREGEKQSIPSDELVEGDLIFLKSGNQIPADARVLDGQIAVNEALLTGEADEIEKGMGANLLSGSFVVSGQAYAVLEKVGADSYISQLSLEAKAMDVGEQSEILKSLNKVLKYVSIVVIPIGLILFSQNFFFNQHNLQSSVVSAVSAIIGMIPEGLYLLTTLALVMGSVKLARQQVMLHNMKSIESLAHVDTLCVDKTGTITEPTMQVQRIIPSREQPLSTSELESLLARYVGASQDDNETMKALERFVLENDLSFKPFPVKKVLPFSSSVKFGGIHFSDGVYLLGAPEFVLGPAYKEALPDFQEELTSGNRVLALARHSTHELSLPLQGSVTPLAYLVLANPIRENAVRTFAYFAEQDVTIKVISGDNPETVSKVASQAGIQDATSYVDASELQSEADFDQAIEKYTVFGRVTPEQKRLLVQALHRADRTVAMTGDGVNDILAMKEADCSIAMASGSEAATQVAQVVLLDNDFDRMTDVLHEGRRVVNNVQRSAILFLNKNIFSMILAIISMTFFISYPIKASQLSLISAFTIGIPGFLLSLEVNTKRIRKNFIRQVMMKAFPASLTSIATVLTVMLAGKLFHISSDQVSSAGVILMAVVGFMIMIEISLPMNSFKWGVVLINLIGILIAGLLMPRLFSLSSLSLGVLLLVAALSVLAFFIYQVLDKAVMRWNRRHS